MLKVDSANSYLSSGLFRKLKFNSIVLRDIYKQIVLILSCLSDSAQGRRGSYFQAHALYLLEQARVLIIGKYGLLGVINTIYKHYHA